MSTTTYRHYSEVSVFCSGDVVESARQQIDKEVQELYETARNLKTRRNTLASVSRLPPEVFYKIFMFLPGNSVRATDHYNVDGTHLWWIEISHVCRHWRSVALSCPRLWSSIVFTRPSWTNEMLKRSKAAPLVVRADLTYMTPRMVDAVQLALRDIYRTKQLHLAASKALMEKLINSLSASAPYLQSLCLSNTRHGPHLLDNEWYTLPESLFNGDAPRLRRLELIKCNPRWDSPLLSGLTQLQIHSTSASARPTIQQLLAALGRMPLLQTLDLQNALPSIPNGTPFVAGSPVVLSHLSSLRLMDLVLECASLLNHITFPATTCLELVCATVGSTTCDFSSLFPAISSVSHEKEGSITLRSFLVESMAPRIIRLQGWAADHVTDNPRSNPLCDHPPHINLSLTWSGIGEGTAEQVMTDVCKSLSLMQLQALSVYNLSRVHKRSLREAFGRLQKLQTIRVRGTPTYGLVKALVTKVGGKHAEQRQSRHKGAPSGDVSFPALRQLIIEDTDFSRHEDDGFMDDFMDMLMERSERQVEVEALHLSRCRHLMESDVDLFKELVVDVFWDGMEDGFDDDDDDDSERFYNHGDESFFGIYDSDAEYYFDYGDF